MLARIMGWPGSGLIGRDVGIDLLFEYRQWQGTLRQHHIVEISNIIGIAQRVLGHCPQSQDFQHADFVSRGLASEYDIAVDGIFDIALWIWSAFSQIINGFLAGPLVIMNAGINDETTGTPQLHRESTKSE